MSGARLDGVQERLVDSALRQAKLGGVELTGTTKERFNEIRLRLASIATQFRFEHFRFSYKILYTFGNKCKQILQRNARTLYIHCSKTM